VFSDFLKHTSRYTRNVILEQMCPKHWRIRKKV